MENYKEKAKKEMNGNWGNVLLSKAVVLTISAIAGIGWVVASPLKLGSFQALEDITSEKKFETSVLYSKYKEQFGSSLLLYLFEGAFTILIAVIAVILLSILMGIFSAFGLLFVLPIVFIALCFETIYADTAWYVLLKEDNLDGNEAFSKGYNLAKGHEWDFVKQMTKYIGGLILTLITFGIAGIYYLPQMSMASFLYVKDIYDGKLPIKEKVETTETKETEEVEETEAENTSSEIEALDKTDEQTGVVFCTQCGFKNSSESTFCIKCGAKLKKGI